MVYRQCIRWKKGLVNTQCEIEVQISDDDEVYIIKNGIVKRVKGENDIIPYINAISPAFRALVLSKLPSTMSENLYRLVYKIQPFNEIRKVSERTFSIWSGSYPSFITFLNLPSEVIKYLPPSRMIEIDPQYYVHIEPLYKSIEKHSEWANDTVYFYGQQVCIALRGCTYFGDEAYSVKDIDQGLNVIKLWLFHIILGSGTVVVDGNVKNLEKFLMLRYDKGFEFLESKEEAGKLEIEVNDRKIRMTLNDNELLSLDYTSPRYIKFSYPLSWKSRYSISDFVSSLKMWKGT
ncbi:MAG: hypothetical protein QXY87_08015 [Saccharolobus sp.]|uniref:hypothetical protein n=1 Tax=Saccharolobus TaxID=2100760 RepID=UPI001F10058A|nr:hypothetical protein [Saccharolobus shibatae]